VLSRAIASETATAAAAGTRTKDAYLAFSADFPNLKHSTIGKLLKIIRKPDS
jgi:CTP:molybdopterin cytidylyltransferase MocA